MSTKRCCLCPALESGWWRRHYVTSEARSQKATWLASRKVGLGTGNHAVRKPRPHGGAGVSGGAGGACRRPSPGPSQPLPAATATRVSEPSDDPSSRLFSQLRSLMPMRAPDVFKGRRTCPVSPASVTDALAEQLKADASSCCVVELRIS